MANIFSTLFATIWADGTDRDGGDQRQWGLEAETALAALMETFGPPLINGRIAASVGSSALTVSITNAAGSTPSAADPVYLCHRDPTASDGDIDHIEIAAALSVTIDGGATLGASDGTPFRLWLVAFNDGGTERLGLVNLNGVTTIYPLEEGAVASSTAVSAAADSAGVIYTGSAVTSKAFRILGYLTWESGLTTAGTWDAVPSTIQMMGPGVHRPGDIVQRVLGTDGTGAETTTATTMPADNTTPQNTEGVELMTQAITPVSAANVLDIRARMNLAHSAAGTLSAALFQDSTAGALVAKATDIAAADDAETLDLHHRMLAATASSTTFKVRAGSNQAGDLMFNGVNGTQYFNGVGLSEIDIAEIFA